MAGAGRRGFDSLLVPQGRRFGVAMGRLAARGTQSFQGGFQIGGADGRGQGNGGPARHARKAEIAAGAFHGKRQFDIQQPGPDLRGLGGRGERRRQAAHEGQGGRRGGGQRGGTARHLARRAAERQPGFLRIRGGRRHGPDAAPARGAHEHHAAAGELHAVCAGKTRRHGQPPPSVH